MKSVVNLSIGICLRKQILSSLLIDGMNMSAVLLNLCVRMKDVVLRARQISQGVANI